MAHAILTFGPLIGLLLFVALLSSKCTANTRTDANCSRLAVETRRGGTDFPNDASGFATIPSTVGGHAGPVRESAAPL